MNAKKMKYDDGVFECIFDKACFDTNCVGENYQSNSSAFLKETYRCLAPGGIFISISYGNSDKRMKFFDERIGANGEK